MPIASSSCGSASTTSVRREITIVSTTAAVVAGDHADGHADRHRDRRRDGGDEQRGARAVEHAHEEVASRAVGAEPEARVRPLRDAELVESCCVDVFGPCPTRSEITPANDREQHQQDHDHDPPSIAARSCRKRAQKI